VYLCPGTSHSVSDHTLFLIAIQDRHLPGLGLSQPRYHRELKFLSSLLSCLCHLKLSRAAYQHHAGFGGCAADKKYLGAFAQPFHIERTNPFPIRSMACSCFIPPHIPTSRLFPGKQLYFFACRIHLLDDLPKDIWLFAVFV